MVYARLVASTRFGSESKRTKNSIRTRAYSSVGCHIASFAPSMPIICFGNRLPAIISINRTVQGFLLPFPVRGTASGQRAYRSLDFCSYRIIRYLPFPPPYGCISFQTDTGTCVQDRLQMPWSIENVLFHNTGFFEFPSLSSGEYPHSGMPSESESALQSPAASHF